MEVYGLLTLTYHLIHFIFVLNFSSYFTLLFAVYSCFSGLFRLLFVPSLFTLLSTAILLLKVRHVFLCYCSKMRYLVVFFFPSLKHKRNYVDSQSITVQKVKQDEEINTSLDSCFLFLSFLSAFSLSYVSFIEVYLTKKSYNVFKVCSVII